ncbi:IS4 family transposase, partial [Photobacterium swingsii]
MRDIQILHESLENQCPNIHKKRHCIKRVDRLLGNNHLHHD